MIGSGGGVAMAGTPVRLAGEDAWELAEMLAFLHMTGWPGV
jgi:hypothetical protein